MLSLVLIVIAFVLFVAAAFNVNSPRISLVPAGLAFWVLAELVRLGFVH